MQPASRPNRPMYGRQQGTTFYMCKWTKIYQTHTKNYLTHIYFRRAQKYAKACVHVMWVCVCEWVNVCIIYGIVQYNPKWFFTSLLLNEFCMLVTLYIFVNVLTCIRDVIQYGWIILKIFSAFCWCCCCCCCRRRPLSEYCVRYGFQVIKFE